MSGKLIPVKLRCSSCQAVHEIALHAEKPIRHELAVMNCPTCGLTAMRLETPFTRLVSPPMRPPPSSERRPRTDEDQGPDMEGDEYLIGRRLGKHWRDVT